MQTFGIGVSDMKLIVLAISVSFAVVSKGQDKSSPEFQSGIDLVQRLYDEALHRDDGRSYKGKPNVRTWEWRWNETAKVFMLENHVRWAWFRTDGSLRAVSFSWNDADGKELTVRPEQALSLVECEQTVRSYLSHCGFSESLTFWGDMELGGNGSMRYKVEARRETKPWPLAFQYSAIVEIDRSAGQLRTLMLPKQPDLSHANDEVLEDSVLNRLAEEAYWQNEPLALGKLATAWTQLEVPAYEDPKTRPAEYVELVGQFKAIPLRIYQVNDLETLNDKGVATDFQWVILDARNGRFLKVETWRLSQGRPRSVPMGEAPIFSGKWLVPSTKACVELAAVDIVVPPKDGRPIQFQKDSWFINGFYSSGSNLLYCVTGTGATRKVIAGRPDEASRRLILKSLASKHN